MTTTFPGETAGGPGGDSALQQQQQKKKQARSELAEMLAHDDPISPACAVAATDGAGAAAAPAGELEAEEGIDNEADVAMYAGVGTDVKGGE